MQPNEFAKTAIAAIVAAKTLTELDALEVRFLGRRGELAELFKQITGMDPEARKRHGEALNAAKQAIESVARERRSVLAGAAYGALGASEWIDVTQPGTRPPEGHLHLTSHAIRDITRIFERIGFYRVRYPEVDWDWYAFESLNMPKDHPARDEWETFFVARPETNEIATHHKYGKMVLTPHTSNGQVREMETGRMPIRMINIAKCYRRQSDISHVPMFHQFEGMYIDTHVTLAHLKGVFDHFVNEFFGKERKTRLRPHHFRFTEPSVELDISCDLCDGTGYIGEAPSTKHQISNKSQITNHKSQTNNPTTYNLQPTTSQKCRMCKSGWLELGGAGMINHNVLRAGKIDPAKYSGFAFGWGVERTAMMRSGLKIDDIRILYKNDLRFLKQF